MDKLAQNDELSRALGAVSEERDRLLGSVPALSRARRAALNAVLAREFPVEGALNKTTAQRDRLLEATPREIPRVAALALRAGLTIARKRVGRGWLANFPTRRALVTACLSVALGMISFGQWRSRRIAPPDESLTNQRSERVAAVPLALASPRQLSLRMSAAEMASSRATFLAVNRTSLNADAAESASLRLDLPVRALLASEGIAAPP